MILGFKTHFEDGTPTNFREKILSGVKQTTIRRDPNKRLHFGGSLSFEMVDQNGNHDQFAEGKVGAMVFISIEPAQKRLAICAFTSQGIETFEFDDSSPSFERLVSMEGFDSKDQFWKWFDKPFDGKLIHWEKLTPTPKKDPENAH